MVHTWTWDERQLLWLLISSGNIKDTKHFDCSYFKKLETTGFHSPLFFRGYLATNGFGAARSRYDLAAV